MPKLDPARLARLANALNPQTTGLEVKVMPEASREEAIAAVTPEVPVAIYSAASLALRGKEQSDQYTAGWLLKKPSGEIVNGTIRVDLSKEQPTFSQPSPTNPKRFNIIKNIQNFFSSLLQRLKKADKAPGGMTPVYGPIPQVSDVGQYGTLPPNTQIPKTSMYGNAPPEKKSAYSAAPSAKAEPTYQETRPIITQNYGPAPAADKQNPPLKRQYSQEEIDTVEDLLTTLNLRDPTESPAQAPTPTPKPSMYTGSAPLFNANAHRPLPASPNQLKKLQEGLQEIQKLHSGIPKEQITSKVKFVNGKANYEYSIPINSNKPLVRTFTEDTLNDFLKKPTLGPAPPVPPRK